MSCAVALINPKYPHNVGGAWRACSVFGAAALAWTPERVEDPEDWPEGARLPREERMKLYHDVAVTTRPPEQIIDFFVGGDRGTVRSVVPVVPVCVEVDDSAEQLPHFEHPHHAIYVFGPEDGNVPKGIRAACHRFVTIPSKSCLNLASAVNVVLYDRLVKMEPR